MCNGHIIIQYVRKTTIGVDGDNLYQLEAVMRYLKIVEINQSQQYLWCSPVHRSWCSSSNPKYPFIADASSFTCTMHRIGFNDKAYKYRQESGNHFNMA